jgi:glycosyltransferase involved in cell wall biosynthesis
VAQPPLIAVDALLVSKRPKGAGRVLQSLVEVLPEVDATHRYVALVQPEGKEVLTGATAAELVEVAPGSGARWELRGAQRAAAAAGADLLFTVRELVGFGGVPTVMHLFEAPAWRLEVEREPGVAGLKQQAKDRFLDVALRGSIRRAAAVTAGSETTADYVARRYGTRPSVVLPGIDRVFLASAPVPAEGTYFLHLASGDARENTDLVLRAFARASLDGIRLKTFGSPQAVRGSLRDRAAALGVADRVDVLEWVSDDDLRSLYAGALALLHPSRYESFAGLPALEAMALGSAVIALDAPGATEGLSGAALLLAREDEEELGDALELLSRDHDARDALAAAGRERAQTLTWESSARGFSGVFAHVLGR